MYPAAVNDFFTEQWLPYITNAAVHDEAAGGSNAMVLGLLPLLLGAAPRCGGDLL